MAIKIFFIQKYAKVPKYYDEIKKFNNRLFDNHDFEA